MILAPITAYVVLLTAASFVTPRQRNAVYEPATSFAILIPAHNEELLLGRLLDSLAALDYPSDLFDVFVVADNCSDGTASIARDLGALVWERADISLVGKGYALRWLMEKISNTSRKYDAFIIFDADSIVSTNFLRVMNDRLLSGSQVVQAFYSVANPSASAAAALRYIALALVHYVRPMGKRLFGGSAGLKGNGMCFSASVIEKHGWSAFTLAEDVEYHLRLVLSGMTVDFAPDAVVSAEMPGSLRNAKSQNLRWERGRLGMLREYLPCLLRSSVRTRNLAQFDAALELMIPPFSVPVALSGACLIGGMMLGSSLVTVVALILVAGQLLYVIAGLALVRAPWKTYLSLLHAPIYVAWKVWLYALALRGADQKWIRTSRV
ncbi:MAG: glycosyltransferase family 2 protein [Chloroflexi bacterium]|nr:glycosyltransferase family 2 protein [Chloroflexota bacterium]